MKLLSREEIITRLREMQENFSMQDNVGAAHTARVLSQFLLEIEGKLPEPTIPKAQYGTPSIEELRKKYLGPQ